MGVITLNVIMLSGGSAESHAECHYGGYRNELFHNAKCRLCVVKASVIVASVAAP
jgi:hypothetical protein